MTAITADKGTGPLHKRSPLLAMTLMLGLFGLAGIPPTAGFTGKFLVFAAALDKGYLFLVIIGMVNATISSLLLSDRYKGGISAKARKRISALFM